MPLAERSDPRFTADDQLPSHAQSRLPTKVDIHSALSSLALTSMETAWCPTTDRAVSSIEEGSSAERQFQGV